jgi:hypothetical protein
MQKEIKEKDEVINKLTKEVENLKVEIKNIQIPGKKKFIININKNKKLNL